MTDFLFRQHQTAAADAVENAWRSGIRRPLADMCVGSGKSLTIAELSRRANVRGERSLILTHRQELTKQDWKASTMLGLQCGINAAKLGERTWRGSVISAMIQSVFRNAASFGPIDNIFIDEAHMIPHNSSGMFREFLRGFPHARIAGFSGTVFRLQGGSLVEGEEAPFDRVVYTYPITQGIDDRYLVPAFSAESCDKIDASKLKKTAGEYTGASQDEQMIALMDSHIMQMKSGGADRKAWLIFEASQKSALAMTERLNAWGIPAAVVIDKTTNREAIYSAFERGQLRALVNVEALTTGYDSQRIDLVCFRRRTASLGLYIQMAGRGLRTVGGNIESSVAAGKADCLFYDFADLIGAHGPLDFIRPKDTRVSLVTCESCKKRVPVAAARCWNCDEPMFKLCPACLEPVEKGTLDCPHCNHDMRTGGGGSRETSKLLATPSGAALISSYRNTQTKVGGWLPVQRMWQSGEGYIAQIGKDQVGIPDAFNSVAGSARWLRMGDDGVLGILVPNGSSRSTVRQYSADGSMLIVPMPQNSVDNS